MGQAGVIKIADFDILQYISLITAFTALECMRGIGKPYVESLASGSDLPPPPHGSNWGHNVTDFVFLPYIFFIVEIIHE